MTVCLTHWVSLLAVLAIYSTTAAAQRAALEIFPAQLTLPVNSAAHARLILRNPTQQVLKDVRLEVDDVPGVRVGVQPEKDQEVTAQSAVTWKLTFLQVLSGTLAEDVRFLVHYTEVGSDNTLTHDMAVAKISLSSHPGEDVSKVGEVQIHSSLSELNDFRPGYVYLEVRNKSAGPIIITEVQIAEWPDFIALSASPKGQNIMPTESIIPYPYTREISTGESRIFPVYVKAGDQVRPGKHQLVFNVRFQRMVDGELHTGSLVAKHEFQVRVFGEGEILGALANVSSFLILPGFLLVVVAGMVWRLFVPGTLRGMLDIGPSTLTDARFWVVAVTLSLLIAWQAYPWLSRILLLGQRNYLYGYGFQDIIWMWLLSIIMGAALSLVVAGIAGLVIGFQVWREWSEAKIAFNDYDSPVTALSKASQQGLQELWLREVMETETEKKGYLLDKDTPGKTSLWVIPRIVIRYYEDDNGLRERIEELLNNEQEDLSKLVDLLKSRPEAGSERGIHSVDWFSEANAIHLRLAHIERSKLTLGEKMNTFLHHTTWTV